MARQPKPITPAQIKAIHVLAGRIGLDDEAYRAIIARLGQGVTTSKDLTQREASAVIRELEGKLGQRPGSTAATPAIAKARAATQRPKTPDSQGNVVALATPAQAGLIDNMITEIDWHQHGGFAAWLKRNMGIDKVQTKEQAQKVINGLKGLKRHGHAKPSGFSR